MSHFPLIAIGAVLLGMLGLAALSLRWSPVDPEPEQDPEHATH